jgi:hypothetical protein
LQNVEVPARSLRRRRAKEKVLPHPVPIIAPPENHVVGSPVSAEGLAVLRVKKFLERELDQRAVEGRTADFFHAGTNAINMTIDADSPGAHRTIRCSFWEDALGIGKQRRLKVINWLLNVCCLRSDNIRD